MTRGLVVLLVALLAACSAFGPGEARRYYVPEATAGAAPEPGARWAGVLLVAPPTVAAFYDTEDIAYSKAAGQRAYYQHSAWTEPPGRRLALLLARRLDDSGRFAVVAVAGLGVRGNLMLATHLEELYHDATAVPGQARITLVAELIDPSHRALVARKSFSSAMPLSTHDAAGTADACGRALGTILDEVVAWSADQAARLGPAR
jgi:ABC-type uncharacterized transport system auxiliary subunit